MADEAALARRAAAGNRAAFDELVRRTARLVYARLYLDTGDRHRAEDLTQETFLKAFASVRKLKDPGIFRPWLLAIAGNVAKDAGRRDGRLKRAGAVPLVADVPKDADGPDADAERAEARERVLAALRELPDEYRLPLTMRYIGGADADAIGEHLGLTDGSVRGYLHRGLKLLRDRLPPEFGE